jgi:hypothetical protein
MLFPTDLYLNSQSLLDLYRADLPEVLIRAVLADHTCLAEGIVPRDDLRDAMCRSYKSTRQAPAA